jgi:predicted amidophosphoribosyltransferase
VTERAKRAVAMLQNLGWGCRDDSTKSCRKCDYPVEREWRYCPQCGAEAHPYPAQDAVDDLEMAIAAALKE